jgi:glycerol uptake facilitator-like aquaporin
VYAHGSCEDIGTLNALVTEERVNHPIAGLGVGAAYGAAILALTPITGASANFARTFGTELSVGLGGGTTHWADLWIYAVGPLVGGIAAVIVYDVLVAGRPLLVPTSRPRSRCGESRMTMMLRRT